MTASSVPARLAWLRLRPVAAGLLLLNTTALCFVVYGESGHTGIHHGNTQGTLLALSALTGVALGFAGWADGLTKDGWSMLAHQPVSRGRVFAGRLLVGLGLHAAVLGLPWLLVSAYHATPGAVAAPYFPEMTGVGLVWILAGVPVHLAAVATVLREARWFGTRVLWLGLAAYGFVFVTEIPSLYVTLGWIALLCVLLGGIAWTAYAARASRSAWNPVARGVDRLALAGVAGAALFCVLLVPPIAEEFGRNLGLLEAHRVRTPVYELQSDGRPVARVDEDSPEVEMAHEAPLLQGGIWVSSAPGFRNNHWAELSGLYEELRGLRNGRAYLDFRRNAAVVYRDRPVHRWLGRTPIKVTRLPTAVGEAAINLLSPATPPGSSTDSGRSSEVVGGNTPRQGLFAVKLSDDQLDAGRIHRIAEALDPSAADSLFQPYSAEKSLAPLQRDGEPAVLEVVAVFDHSRIHLLGLSANGGVRRLAATPQLAAKSSTGRVEFLLTKNGHWAALQRTRSTEASAWWTSDGSHGEAGEWSTLPPLEAPRTATPPKLWLRWLPTLAAPAWWHLPWTLEPVWGRSPFPVWLLLAVTGAAAAAAAGVARWRRLRLHPAAAAAGAAVIGPAFPLALLLERAPRTVADAEPDPPRSAGTRLWVPA